MAEQKESPTTKNAELTRPAEGAVAPRGAWSPWTEMAELRQRMDDLFARAFGHNPLSHLIPAEWKGPEPTVDIHETETGFQLLASLPGYTPEQIRIEATGSGLVIQGERPALVEKAKEKATTHRDNGLSGSSQFQFAYTLPAEIDPNRIAATFENGVLKLELPKTEKARPQSVKVAIQSAP